MGNLLKSLGNLINIPFVLRIVALICIRLRHFPFSEFNSGGLGGKAVSRPCRGQLGERADISGVKFFHFNGLASLKHVQLSNLFLHILIYIVYQIVGLKYAGIYLNQGILADKRVNDGLPDIGGFRLGEIIVRMEDVVGLHINSGHFSVFRAGKILDDIVKQRVNSLTEHTGTHRHGNDASVAHVGAQSRPDFRLRESLSAEVSLHHFFAGLGNRFHKRVAAKLEVCLVVFGNLAFHHFLALPSVSGLGNNVDIAHEFFVFTDWQMERSHLLAEHLRHILHYLTERSVIHIHIADIYHSGELIFFTEFPCFLGAHFHARLAVYHNDNRSGSADCLFHLSRKVKKARCVNYIDFISFPFNGDNGSTN